MSALPSSLPPDDPRLVLQRRIDTLLLQIRIVRQDLPLTGWFTEEKQAQIVARLQLELEAYHAVLTTLEQEGLP